MCTSIVMARSIVFSSLRALLNLDEIYSVNSGWSSCALLVR